MRTARNRSQASAGMGRCRFTARTLPRGLLLGWPLPDSAVDGASQQDSFPCRSRPATGWRTRPRGLAAPALQRTWLETDGRGRKAARAARLGPRPSRLGRPTRSETAERVDGASCTRCLSGSSAACTVIAVQKSGYWSRWVANRVQLSPLAVWLGVALLDIRRPAGRPRGSSRLPRALFLCPPRTQADASDAGEIRWRGQDPGAVVSPSPDSRGTVGAMTGGYSLGLLLVGSGNVSPSPSHAWASIAAGCVDLQQSV